MRQSIESAKVFDSTPSYDFDNTRFYYGKSNSTAFDDFGDTALQGVEKYLKSEPKYSEILLEMWNRLRDER